MNQATNETGTNLGTFSSQAAQSNPFTADLKGEFTSNFGTNTNAVSQIFKDGGFVSQNRTKWIVAAVVFLLLAVGLFYYFSTRDSDEVDIEDTPAATTKTDVKAPVAAATPAVDTKAPAQAAAPAEKADGGSGSVSLTEPADGSSVQYDETSSPAHFSWQGGGAFVSFARSSSMKPETMRVPVSGTSYSFKNPYPGEWYWQVLSQDGTPASDVRKFSVSAPARRNVTMKSPAAGATLAGTGGVVEWDGDSKVAFYRVEMINGGSWANPPYRFATSDTKTGLQGVPAGAYQMRVGAFSEVSGRWEYTTPVNVTVQ